ncbi:hypothetical protein M5D96_011975, partial [Drosophila gunungcola]
GDLVLRFTFGGRYNAGTSANIILSFKYSTQISHFIVYQDPVFRTFQRNSTISFRLDRQLIRLPTGLAIGHDNSGIYPHFFCRNVIIADILTEKVQNFSVQNWVRRFRSVTTYKMANIFSRATTIEKSVYQWKVRFSHAMESYMGNWYLFQPIIGPWRFGTDSYIFWTQCTDSLRP